METQNTGKLCAKFVGASLNVHFSDAVFAAFGAAYAPFVHGLAVVLVLWLVLFWMYRRRIFLRI